MNEALGNLTSLGRVHVMGIGGAGMSGISRILAARGVSVTGCDAKDSRRVAALSALGIDVHIGHSPEHAFDVDTLIISTAIPATNPELVAARERGATVLTRADALAAIMDGYRGIAVAGTHGKTTTTSMLTIALQACGADPSFAIGSELNDGGSNAYLGSGLEFVAEADESDGAFLALPAFAGIVTNVEADHLDYWKTFDAIEAAFLEFSIAISRRGGFVTVCIDDEGGAQLAASTREAGVDVRTYGQADHADYRVDLLGVGDRGWCFDVIAHGVRLGVVELAVPGRHNALNATAALVTGIGLGYSATDLRAGLAGFSGTRRRFEYKGSADRVRVFDDYAHHPTEISATLRAMREVIGDSQLVVAFQAHHYYRTAMFVKEFGQALGLADQVVVLEVFAPGEEAIPGASGVAMASNVPLPAEQVVFEPSWSRVAQHLADRANPGDVVMTLGAGDIAMIGTEVLDLLRLREAASL
jgi:UDP-N-acetylmuramate--alanine ligase